MRPSVITAVPRTAPPLTLLLALLLVVVACGNPTDEPVAGSTDAASPTATLPAGDATAIPASPSAAPPVGSATPTIAPSETAGTIPAQVYYLRDHESGPWLEPVATEVTGPGVARAALDALSAEPPQGLSRAVPAGTTINGVDIDPDGTLTVDFTFPADAGLGASFEQALIDAVALTATQFDGVTQVRFLVDGQASDTLFGHVDVSGPIQANPFAIAPIVITDAVGIGGSGAGGGSIELAGTANTFEATLELELLDAGGNVIESTFTTATCGTGCRGDWTHAFTDLEPDTYTVVAREPDPSDGEGRPPYTAERAITVP